MESPRSRRRRTKKRLLLLGALAFVALVGAAAAYVAIPVAGNLGKANDVLSGPAGDLDAAAIARARSHLVSARDRLGGVVSRGLGLLPVAGQTLHSAREVVGAAVPVVDAAAALRDSLDSLVDTDLVTDGQVQVDALVPMADDLHRQSEALEALGDEADDALGSWVLPPVWERLAELSATAEELAVTTGAAGDLVEILPDVLGVEAPRRYLLLLLNNAELRGGGGILSGIGTVRARDGGLALRNLAPREDLVTDPVVEVEAPGPYEALYGAAGANTTLWVNVPYSPDLEHTAAVAAALWEETQPQKVSGVVFVDPRGLSALLDPGTTLAIGDAGVEVTAAGLPEFVYSRAYQVFESQTERRAAILEAGAEAFDAFLAAGAGGESGIRALGEAAAGGHLGFVSLRPEEQAVLRRATTAHTEPRQVRVVTQNLGDGVSAGTKLDFWVERRVRQECRVEDDGSATCSTRTTFENGVPDGLGRYVGGRPYGVLRSDVQTFLPKGSTVVDATLDGRPANALVDEYGAAPVVSVYARIPQGGSAVVEVVYDVPTRPQGDFRLELVPQPLTEDARLSAVLSLPASWRAHDLEEVRDGLPGFSGSFEGPVVLAASQPERAGLAALWERLRRFWDEPLL